MNRLWQLVSDQMESLRKDDDKGRKVVSTRTMCDTMTDAEVAALIGDGPQIVAACLVDAFDLAITRLCRQQVRIRRLL